MLVGGCTCRCAACFIALLVLQGITFEEARQREGEFFKANNPWCHMFKFADRFGVDHLRANLSQVLVEITNR
jgi:hypothetical protein